MEIIKEEHIVHNGERNIYGKWFFPKDKDIKGAVILSHGYNGIHDDFEYECTTFAENGYLAYAFDFSGGSVRTKSIGLKTTEMTVFTEKDDLLAVFKDISSNAKVSGKKLFLFGGSQGGFVSALALEELQNAVNAAALYYPAFNIPDDWRKNYPDADGIPEVTELMDMTLGKCYFEAIRNYNVFDHIGKYTNPLLIIYGDKDELVPMEAIRNAKEKYMDAKLVILNGEAHGFTHEGCRQAMKDIIDLFDKI
ncbi:alpha/beta hydrolase family protein [Butyrivibrio sp. AC2005]|uniref:alpha/beta hydrolase family protein n=1 Tax=Butyrivibrio sp. AC2005 TaxID=1280672 RepID=UPI0004233D85|nr:alpha/beta fold hydrolase [Butyrivibrio sp. AC2005]